MLLHFFTSSSQNYWSPISIPDSIQIKCLASNNQNDIFLGTGGNEIYGGIYRSTNNGQIWDYLLGNELSNSAITLNEFNHLFADWHGDIIKSMDDGSNWEQVYDGKANVICIKSYQDGLMFANSGTGAYLSLIRSLDFGVTWNEVLVFPSNVESVHDISIFNDDTIYIGTTNWINGGGVYRSVDGGNNWVDIGLNDYHVFALEINSQGDIFAGTYGHNTHPWLSGIYVLRKGETSWSHLVSTLVNDMIINKNNNIYAATDDGVLKSNDDGQSFHYVNEGLFTGVVNDLALDSIGFLYASSYDPCYLSRSINSTITNISEEISESYRLQLFNYPNPCNDYTNFIIGPTSKNNELVTIQLFNSYGQIVEKIEINTSSNTKTIHPFRLYHLPKGVYHYIAIMDAHKISGSLIKF